MHVDVLIEARWLLPIVPRHTVLENQTVVVSCGRIADILPQGEARRRYGDLAEHVVSLPDGLLMPGLVNLHSHAAMNLLRGLGADLPLMDWLTTKIWPAEGKLMSADFVRDGSRLAGLEMIRAGITCTSDQYFFPDAAAEGLRTAGLRCAVSGIVIGFPSAWANSDAAYLSKAETLIKTFADDPFVRTTIAPHAPYTVGDVALARTADISWDFNVPIHIHVNETAGEVADSLRDHGMRPLARLARLGLVNERLISVHSVHTDAEDIRRLADAGSSVCHCPCSNLKLASGFAPIADLMKAGVNLGIGTDGAASNDKLDILGETRLAAMLAKAVANDTTCAGVYDMLEAATLGGARALHWDDEIGSIEIGKVADMIAIDLSDVSCQPVSDPAAQVLYAAGREQVTHTWVAGRLVASREDTASDIRRDVAETARKWQEKLFG